MLKRSLCLVTAVVILLVILPTITVAGRPAVPEKTMIPVTAVNHAPVARNQSIRTAEDTAKVIRLRATDADRNPLNYTIISGPAQGTLAGAPPTVTYTPNPNYYGPDKFTFKANDGSVDSNVATVSIAVTAVNDAPAALNQNVTTYKNTALAITLSGTDVEGNPLSYKIVSKPSNGKLAGTGSNQTYTPNMNFQGPDRFTFKVNDGKAGSTIATVSITVMPINHAPVAQDQSITADEDTTKAITLIAADVDGDSLIYQIVAHPSHGALSGAPPSVTYTPTANYNGSDSFTFKANDGKADSNIATVSISVTAVNDSPVAQNQSVTTEEDTPKAITLVATDVDSDSLTYSIVSQPSHGTLTGTPPNVTYTPNTHYSGADIFTFKVNDGKLDSNLAAITITVNAKPPLPTVSISANPRSIAVGTSTILSWSSRNANFATIDQDIGQVKLDGEMIVSPIVTTTYTITVTGPGGSAFNSVTVEVLRIEDDRIIITMAGNGEWGSGFDGGPATEAGLSSPVSVAFDTSGNVYIADSTGNRIRKVDRNGIIYTVAGTGIRGYSGDGRPAAQAQLYGPRDVAVDASGNLVIADFINERVRKVDKGGIIRTMAGNGEQGYSGDGGPADEAMLNDPAGLAADGMGNIYIADFWNHRIRKVDSKRIITTIAGSGELGYSGDNGPALQAKLYGPWDVTVDISGNLFIADQYNHRIRKVDKDGIITTIAGNGTAGYGGDSGPAINAMLNYPSSIAVDGNGNLFIADVHNNRVRKVDSGGIITTVAGTGGAGYGGDGGAASKAMLNRPSGVAVDAMNNLYIADQNNCRVRLVLPKKSTISGRVTDSFTSSPSSNVMVRIEDSFYTFTSKTDSDGMYSISGLSPGDFMATFEKLGYFRQTATGVLDKDIQYLHIQLVSMPPLSLIVTTPEDDAILSSSSALVTGTVTNIATVRVNDIEVPVTNNAFSISIPLEEGWNYIGITATDQYDQYAFADIGVTLVTRGAIAGKVTDALTGLPIQSATVSITDSSHLNRTVLTNDNGRYLFTDFSFGSFEGTISKDGYSDFSLSGTISYGQVFVANATLTPSLPMISNILVSGITTDSATITWITDQAADSLVDYGATSFYGNWVKDPIMATNHSVVITNLTPGTTYHFKVTSTNTFGFSSSSGNRTFETQSPLLTLVITSPANGAIINRPDIMVKGTVINARGNETGVTVNGKIAMVFGTEFVVNHIPLQGGSNTLEAIATDTEANTAATSVVVSDALAEEYINLTTSTESGISPLEVVLTIDSSLDLADATLTNIGPVEVEFLSRTVSEYRVRLTAIGSYYFTVSLNSGGTLYQDSIGIVALSEADLDALLRGKWEAMRNRLATGDIEGALVSFDEFTKQDYRDLFNVLSSMLPTIVQEMADIRLLKYRVDTAIFDIRTIRDAVENSFQLLFTKDSAGIWRINSF